MQKAYCFGWVAAVVLGSALWADTGIVHLTDGTTATGEINDSDPKQVVVTLHGVHEAFPREAVMSIEYPGSVDEQYAKRLTNLGPRDVKGRLELATWAAGQERYDLARRAAAEALAIEPGNPDATDLLKANTHEAALTTGIVEASPSTNPSNPSGTMTILNPATAVAADQGYLSEDQINEIRQVEMKAGEPVRVTFLHDVRKRYLRAAGLDTAAFYSLSLADQAWEILTRGDPALANDVRITSDPAALAEFRTGASHIQPVIVSGCAVSGCHNPAVGAGGFVLYSNDVSPRAAYTNFFRLTTYKTAGSLLEASRKMIDRIYPEQSLLAEYGLPQRLAQTPHPKAQDFKPVFTGKNDPHYQSLLHWISFDLKPDGGKYGFQFAPATQPVGVIRATTAPGK